MNPNPAQHQQLEHGVSLFFPARFTTDETRRVGPLQEPLGELICMYQVKINGNPVDLPWKDSVPKSALETSPDMLTFAA